MTDPDLSGHRFSRTHEWVKVDGDAAVIGVTDHAQAQLGDVIFVELPTVGARFVAGERFGVIESVKAASDLYCPIGGTVTAVNEALTDHPENVNEAPYGEGWLIGLGALDATNPALLDAVEYGALTEG